MASCYPGGPEDVQDLDVAIAVRNPDKDFSGFRQFAMPDTIIHLHDPDETGVDLSRDYDRLILDRIEQRMQDFGWQRVVSPDSLAPPDVFLLVSATASANWYIYGGYPYWDWWWGWYPGYPSCPGCGWWYPWYPPTTVVKQSIGTLVLEIFDPRDFDEVNERQPVSWGGALNGLLQGTSSTTQRRLVDGIDQIFAQSPYLRVQ